MSEVAQRLLAAIVEDRRPWGSFRRYAYNEQCTVKVITVEAGQVLSLQSHTKRDELWVALDAGLVITLGADELRPQPGEEIVIPRGTKHRLGAEGATARVLEIAFGEFDEDDIERFEDVYGRS